MDPINPAPGDHAHGAAGSGGRLQGEPARRALPSGSGRAATRAVRLVAGDYLLTVNPVDGSEIELCPPTERPALPARHSGERRDSLRRAARPPVPGGPALPRPPLLDRHSERERLVRLLARGRSVRLTGVSGTGRTALLDAVAEDCAGLAPDGVVRLRGHRRTAHDLLHDLFAAVYDSPGHRPDYAQLRSLLRAVGAVVIVDDLEFGGSALAELLDATPECAFLFASTPDAPAPDPDSHLEESVLSGLSRRSGLDLLERIAGRALTDDEVVWADDLWFASEGLPLRYLQAGALVRRRVVQDPHGYRDHTDDPFGTADAPLPLLSRGSAPAVLLASQLGESARAVLRFAVALGGELPHQAHLPALVGDTHADTAVADLVGCGLVTAAGPGYRLAAGVQTQLEQAGYAVDAADHLLRAARHYTWWAGHGSVTAERVCAEADAILAALIALVPSTVPPHGDEEASPAVALARAAAPAFAAGLDWGAWERALRSGQEAARLSGEVADAAYFHHDLGVLALCRGRFDRARAELEASIGLRGVLADKRGIIAGRRALALAEDRSGESAPAGTPALPVAASAPLELAAPVEEPAYEPRPAARAGAVQAALPTPKPAAETVPLVIHQPRPDGRARHGVARPGVMRGARRNLLGASVGAVLVAVLGTVVTLGATSHKEQVPDTTGTPSTSHDDEDDLAGEGPDPTPKATATPTRKGKHAKPSASESARPGTSAAAVPPPAQPPSRPSGRPSHAKPSTSKPSTTKPPTTKPPTTKPPTTPPPTTEPPTEPPTEDPTSPGTPDASDSVSASQTAPSGDDPAQPAA